MTAHLIAAWLTRLANDNRLSLYDFRFALRLSSKVRGDDLQASVKKLRPKADTPSIAVLMETGYLLEIEGGQLPYERKQSLYLLLQPEAEVQSS